MTGWSQDRAVTEQGVPHVSDIMLCAVFITPEVVSMSIGVTFCAVFTSGCQKTSFQNTKRTIVNPDQDAKKRIFSTSNERFGQTRTIQIKMPKNDFSEHETNDFYIDIL